MKVILTGCTGFIGNEVLKQCLQNPSITSVVVLARRALDIRDHPKLTVHIIDNFLSYPEPLLKDLEGAQACIWTLGKALMNDMNLAREIHVDYTLAAAKAFDQALGAKIPAGKKFRFIFCSGALAERDQNKSLWMAGEYRRIRGMVENELVAYAKEHSSTFEAYIVRPGMVVSSDAYLKYLVFGLFSAIKVDILGKVMIETALNGNQKQILENSDMIS
ncbi:hypothetical protein BJX96DRAFT_146836 [Aspergillus floccosus]